MTTRHFMVVRKIGAGGHVDYDSFRVCEHQDQAEVQAREWLAQYPQDEYVVYEAVAVFKAKPVEVECTNLTLEK